MSQTGIMLSKSFEDVLKLSGGELLGHCEDAGTLRYEALYNGRKVYSSRLTLMQAAGVVRSFLYNKENIEKACRISDSVVFRESDTITPYDKMRVEIKSGKASIALNTKVIDEELMKLFNPKIEEWFSAVMKSNTASVQDFDSKVEFSNSIVYSEVKYSGSSYMILIDADTKRIWAFEDGYTQDITNPGFKGALQKLHFMANIA